MSGRNHSDRVKNHSDQVDARCGLINEDSGDLDQEPSQASVQVRHVREGHEEIPSYIHKPKFIPCY